MIKYICDHLDNTGKQAITNILVYDDNTAYIYKYCTICGHEFTNMSAIISDNMEYKEYMAMIDKLKEVHSIDLKEKKGEGG